MSDERRRLYEAMGPTPLTLADPARADVYTFHVGPPMRMRDDGTLRLETWRDRWRTALSEAFWPSPQYVVTKVDVENGVVTVGRKR